MVRMATLELEAHVRIPVKMEVVSNVQTRFPSPQHSEQVLREIQVSEQVDT